MISTATNYLQNLVERFGAGWNRFWFTPSDPFTLSILRVFVGAIALYLHLTFTPDLIRLFGPDGMLPVDTVQSLVPGIRPSVLNYVTDPVGLWIVHIGSAVVLLLFTVGLWSRLTSVLALFVTLSYIHRAPMLTAQVEFILSILMLYLCFGPCGAYCSVNRLLRLRRTANQPDLARSELRRVQPSPWATLAIRLIQVHLTIVYVMGGISKFYGDQWLIGQAAWWLLARPESRPVDLTTALYTHTYVINFWTHAIMLFDLVFAVLVWNRTARPLLIVLGVIIWTGTAIATGLIPFALAMMTANLAFASPKGLKSLFGRRANVDTTQIPVAENRRQVVHAG